MPAEFIVGIDTPHDGCKTYRMSAENEDVATYRAIKRHTTERPGEPYHVLGCASCDCLNPDGFTHSLVDIAGCAVHGLGC